LPGFNPLHGLRIYRRGLRRFRTYGRVPSLHLERGKGLWPQNKKKDLSSAIDGAGVGPIVHPPSLTPRLGHSLTSRLPPLICTRVREFPSPFHPSLFLWAVPR